MTSYFVSFSQDSVTVLLFPISLLILLSKSLRMLFVVVSWWGEWETLCFLKVKFSLKIWEHSWGDRKEIRTPIILEQCFLFGERHCEISVIVAFQTQSNACVFLNPSFRNHLKAKVQISKGNVHEKPHIIFYTIIVIYPETVVLMQYSQAIVQETNVHCVVYG